MRGFLLDTNVPSELVRPQPEPRVKTWVAGIFVQPYPAAAPLNEVILDFHPYRRAGEGKGEDHQRDQARTRKPTTEPVLITYSGDVGQRHALRRTPGPPPAPTA